MCIQNTYDADDEQNGVHGAKNNRDRPAWRREDEEVRSQTKKDDRVSYSATYLASSAFYLMRRSKAEDVPGLFYERDRRLRIKAGPARPRVTQE
jgi:hypothetical protein